MGVAGSLRGLAAQNYSWLLCHQHMGGPLVSGGGPHSMEVDGSEPHEK
jgi:hypothetical protein